MMKHWWLWPIVLGTPAGVTMGVYLCWHDPACLLYAGSHLYRLLTLTLARTVDVYTLLCVGILAAVCLAIASACRFRGVLRLLLLMLLPLGVLGAAGTLFLPAQVWSMLLPVLTDPRWYVYGLLLVGLGIFVTVEYRILRARRPPRSAAVRNASRFGPVAGTIGRVVLRMVSGVSLLLLLGINLAAGVLWAHAAITVRTRPNIILIMVCSLRADHLGCYGYDLNTSPNLDRFARESTRFAQAVAPSSWTLWSTASILTSRYPERIFNNSDFLSKHSLYPGLPPVLSNMGYATAVVTDHPFLAEESLFSYDYRQGFDSFTRLGDDSFMTKLSPEVTSRALARARQYRGRPFFLYTMYADPHSPYVQHPEFPFGPSAQDTPGAAWAASLARPVQPAALAHRVSELARYNSEIAFTDQAIGELLTGLKRLGLYDDALIIICADHGEEFLDHGSYGHMATLYREVIAVPLIVKYPRQRVGKVIGGRFPLIDLFPSILGMIRGDAAHLGLQGERIDLPALLRCTDKPIFCTTTGEVKSVLSGPYKYCEMGTTIPWWGYREYAPSSRDKAQLFNVTHDPGEYANRLQVEPDIADTLLGLRHRHDAAQAGNTDTRFGAPRAITPSAAEQVRQRMKSLGYLQE